jgi:hypothetical protein
MKTIFCSHASDDWYEPVGAKKLLNSSNYFHPDIEMKIFRSDAINTIKHTFPWMCWMTLNPYISKLVSEDYELTVHFDADSIITGKLDEILLADYDIAGVRNNTDYGFAGGTGQVYGQHLNPTIPEFDAKFKYLNAGLIASTRKDFWDEFCADNVQKAFQWCFGEQDIWNFIFWSGKYNSKILDDVSSNVYYGTSAHHVLPGQDFKESWKSLYMKGDQLCLNNKIVKVIHNAGGSYLPKLQYHSWVNNEVKDFLDTITRGS